MFAEKEWFLGKMTWPEAKEALLKADCVIIPVGSIEQHGHHIAVGNDVFTPMEVIRRVVELSLPKLRLVVTPVVNYGVSEHHMFFPGTVTLKVETFMNVIHDICRSLIRHGVKRIAVFNGHGGNIGPLTQVLQYRLRREFNVEIMLFNWWTYFSDMAQPTHADKVETCVSMYLIPDFVREDKMMKPTKEVWTVDMKEVGWDAKVSPLVLNIEERTDTGGLPPDPASASREYGKKLVETAVERISLVLEKTCKR